MRKSGKVFFSIFFLSVQRMKSEGRCLDESERETDLMSGYPQRFVRILSGFVVVKDMF